MFKPTFKRYKKKMVDLQDVIDLDHYEATQLHSRFHNLINPAKILKENIDLNPLVPVGLQSPCEWRLYKLVNHPGLHIIRNPFTPTGQRYWIARSLRDYPRAPNHVNLDAKHFSIAAISDWWRQLHQVSDKTSTLRLRTGMRWATLGYHYNWDTKVYDEAKYTTFPRDLSSLCKYFSLILGYQCFTPQAAIVNYYPIGTTLSGHTDHSELTHAAPLFSLSHSHLHCKCSFGQTAIFLIGGVTLEEQPTALYLRSGDVLIMSKESRLCYHAVPRVMKTLIEPWNRTNEMDSEMHEDRLSKSLDLELYGHVKDKCFWMPFDNYLKNSRININVRQVLPSSVFE